MMRDNERLLALKIFLIVVSILVMFALGLIVYFYVMVYFGVSKRKLSQIRQVSELVNAKHERRVAMTIALVTIAVILSFFPRILSGILQGIYPVFRQRLAMRVEDTFLYLNSVANPLIYCYRDRPFRNAVLEFLRIRKPKVEPVEMTDAARFRDVSRNDVFGLGKDELQIQKVEKPFRVTRSTSCDLVLFSDQTHFGFHNLLSARTLSCPSLPPYK